MSGCRATHDQIDMHRLVCIPRSPAICGDPCQSRCKPHLTLLERYGKVTQLENGHRYSGNLHPVSQRCNSDKPENCRFSFQQRNDTPTLAFFLWEKASLGMPTTIVRSNFQQISKRFPDFPAISFGYFGIPGKPFTFSPKHNMRSCVYSFALLCRGSKNECWITSL